MNIEKTQLAHQAKDELENVRQLVSRFRSTFAVPGAVHADWDAQGALAGVEESYDQGDYHKLLRQAKDIKDKLAPFYDAKRGDRVIEGVYAFARRLQGRDACPPR